MGAKTWMLVYADTDVREALAGATLDREATRRLVAKLFPRKELAPIKDGSLAWTSPPDKEIYAGCFPGVSVVAAAEFGIDYPSKLSPAFLQATGKKVYLHAMHSVVDWFAYASWADGELVRALSVSPEHGIMEDIGKPLPFEEAFWAGQRPAVDEDEDEEGYPLPFHPLDMGEAALAALFGYQLEGLHDPSLLNPESVPLMRFRSVKPFWKFW
ncbi:MAG: hypothetical protein QM776_10405 [Rhodocyclaceae bacterium]